MPTRVYLCGLQDVDFRPLHRKQQPQVLEVLEIRAGAFMLSSRVENDPVAILKRGNHLIELGLRIRVAESRICLDTNLADLVVCK